MNKEQYSIDNYPDLVRRIDAADAMYDTGAITIQKRNKTISQVWTEYDRRIEDERNKDTI